VPDTMEQAINLHPVLVENDVQGLVFDLDGTLIDSAADILHGMRLTFAQAGLGVLPDDYFPNNLHGTGEGIMRSIVADMGWSMPSDLKPLRAMYVENYAALNHRQTRLYADAQQLLDACGAAELPMGICTNKLHASAMGATRKVGIDGHFRYISGADTWAAAKPSPVPLIETIRMLGLAPEQVLYFGDTSVDAECARQAGVRFVLHTSGYGDELLKGTTQYFSFQHWKELLA
jgi:phosphoglycolate phosphatase-like HAD superfamily hydrolase